MQEIVLTQEILLKIALEIQLAIMLALKQIILLKIALDQMLDSKKKKEPLSYVVLLISRKIFHIIIL